MVTTARLRMEPEGKGPMKVYTTWFRDGSLPTHLLGPMNSGTHLRLWNTGKAIKETKQGW